MLPDDTSVSGMPSWSDVYNPADGHRHVHGANLGIRADRLADLGGWPPLLFDEDVSLVRAADLAGYTIAWTGQIPVLTSSRLVGRAPHGFSTYISDLRDSAPTIANPCGERITPRV